MDLLTGHGEDAGRRRLSVVGHGGHPVGVRGLDDGGHGESDRRRGDDGRRREGDHAGQGDVVHDEWVVAVVVGTQVATDTEALFCKSKKTKERVETTVNAETG